MSNSSPVLRQELAAKLAGARQSLALLKSQLKVGIIEKEYWTARLDDLGSLLDDLNAERLESEQQRRLAALYEVGRVIGSSLDVDEVLKQVMDAIVQLTGAERGFLLLLEEDGSLDVKAARNVARETLEEEEFAISRSVIRGVAETGEPVLTTNAAADPRFSGKASVVTHNLRSIQCVPLRARGQVIGVIYVDNRIRAGAFDENDLELLSAFAAQAAMAIENARLFTLTDKALAARVEELQMLQELDRELNETLDFERTLNLTLQWAVRVTGADSGAIGMIDRETGETRVIAQHGETSAAVAGILKGGDEASGQGSLSVPIQREGRTIGVIALDRKDGRSFDPEARSVVARIADHAATSIENARLYEAVKAANQAKSEFVSVMTHELRMPMTSIKGYAEMLAMVGELNEQQKSFLEIIRSNVQRMTVQVSDLSDISRIESGRLKIEIENDVSLREVLDSVLVDLKTEIEKREHRIALEIPQDLPALRADPQRLGQVLTNLLSNACKYTPNGGAITVRAGVQGRYVWCEVQDTGIGMSAEELTRLFTKFWRSEDRFVREQHGTGLGLAIARNLTEMQGGEMSVRSEKDRGTTTRFTVPVSE